MQRELRQAGRATAERRSIRARQVQKRRLVLVVSTLAIVVVITAVGSYSSRAEATPQPEAATEGGSTVTTAVDPTLGLVSAGYAADLIGDFGADGPSAHLALSYDAASDTLSYSLEITSALANPETAAICAGGAGERGITVATVFNGPAVAGRFSGMLTQGQITAADLTGSLQGARVADLVLLFEDGEAYATIGTTGVPVDALRGQIE